MFMNVCGFQIEATTRHHTTPRKYSTSFEATVKIKKNIISTLK